MLFLPVYKTLTESNQINCVGVYCLFESMHYVSNYVLDAILSINKNDTKDYAN